MSDEHPRSHLRNPPAPTWPMPAVDAATTGWLPPTTANPTEQTTILPASATPGSDPYMTSDAPNGGTSPHRRTRRTWFTVAAVAAAAAVTVVAVIVATDDSDPSTATSPATTVPVTTATLPPATSSPSTTTTATTTQPTTTAPPTTAPGTVGAAGGTIHDHGVTVDIPSGALDGPAEFTVNDIQPPSAFGDALVQAGPVIDINVAGAHVNAPVTITLPITDPAALDPVIGPDGQGLDPADTLMVAHWNGASWEPLPTSVDRAARTVSAQTQTFSPFTIIRIAWDWVKDLVAELVKDISGGVFSAVPHPTCDGTDESEQWEAAPADNPVSYCGARRADGTRFVQVANRRRYSVAVTAPGAKVTNNSTDLSAQLSQLASQNGTVVIAPGETADITFPAEATSDKVNIEYDGFAQMLTTVLISADILAAIAAKLPFSKKATGKAFLADLDLAKCVTTLGIDVGHDVTQSAGTLAKLITSCFKDLIKHVVGAIGAIIVGAIGLIGSIIAYFFASGQALFDLVFGGANGTLTYDAATVNTDTTTTTITSGGTGDTGVWPTHDNEGPPTLYAWFGANLEFPDWVSCSANYCIAGLGDHVELIELSGLVDHGSLPIGTADPAAEFVAAGVPAADVAAFMKPGSP